MPSSRPNPTHLTTNNQSMPGDIEIKYRCAGQAQPTPNPLAKDQLRPKMGGGSPQTPLFTQGGQFCPENGGRIPPNPPLYSRRPILSQEWGEGPPKPPSRHQGTKYALEWGGGSPQTPPLGVRGPKTTFPKLSKTFILCTITTRQPPGSTQVPPGAT